MQDQVAGMKGSEAAARNEAAAGNEARDDAHGVPGHDA